MSHLQIHMLKSKHIFGFPKFALIPNILVYLKGSNIPFSYLAITVIFDPSPQLPTCMEKLPNLTAVSPSANFIKFISFHPFPLSASMFSLVTSFLSSFDAPPAALTDFSLCSHHLIYILSFEGFSLIALGRSVLYSLFSLALHGNTLTFKVFRNLTLLNLNSQFSP